MQEFERTRDALVTAALPHVAFEGWSPTTFRAAVKGAGIEMAAARAACPRGSIELAAAFHRRGDALMAARLRPAALEEMRVRERVAHAVRTRVECIEDREAARRAAALFSMPQLAAEGAALIWNTADAIWAACGDTSEDANWYTKRATLSGVYGSTVLYWLGDESPGRHETWGFLDRRIDDVMSFERLKGQVMANPALRTVFALPIWAMGHVRAPIRAPRVDLPGHWPEAPEGDAAAGAGTGSAGMGPAERGVEPAVGDRPAEKPAAKPAEAGGGSAGGRADADATEGAGG